MVKPQFLDFQMHPNVKTRQQLNMEHVCGKQCGHKWWWLVQYISYVLGFVFAWMVFDATWCMNFLSLGRKLQLDKGFSNVDEIKTNYGKGRL
jgi:hypothetical protein